MHLNLIEEEHFSCILLCDEYFFWGLFKFKSSLIIYLSKSKEIKKALNDHFPLKKYIFLLY